LDELPSVESADDDVATPAWLAREVEAAEAEGFDEETPVLAEGEVPVVPPIEEPAAELEAEGAVEELTVEEAVEIEEAVEEPAVEEAVEPEETPLAAEEEAVAADAGIVEEDIDEDLPEWLTLEEGGAGIDFDWDEMEAGITDWLVAEEETTTLHEMPVPPVPETAVPAKPEAQTQDEEEEEAPPVAELPEFEPEALAQPAAGTLTLDQEQLREAHQALESQDYSEALAAYQALLDSGEGLPLLIADLEEAVAAHEQQPLLRRLLGDAYMRNGQLQRALDAYRQALDNL
jgi:tetratricopeptide (TPR) repeat protein